MIVAVGCRAASRISYLIWYKAGKRNNLSSDGNENPEDIPKILEKFDEGYEMVTWNNGINERPYLLPSIYGTWTVTISGSGLEGVGGVFYSGDYSMKVTSEKLV